MEYESHSKTLFRMAQEGTSKTKALGKKGFLKLHSQTQIEELVRNRQITISNITKPEEFLPKIWTSSRKEILAVSKIFMQKKKGRGGFFSRSFNFCEECVRLCI